MFGSEFEIRFGFFFWTEMKIFLHGIIRDLDNKR